jgi:sensor histidine kinase YesM
MLKRLQSVLGVNNAFIAFIFVFSYFLVVKSRMDARGQLNWYTFTPEGPIAQFFAALMIMYIVSYIIKKYIENQKLHLVLSDYVKISGIAFVFYILLANALSLLIAVIFDTVDRNFNSHTLLILHFSRVVDFILFSSLYLAYYHIKQAADDKAKIAKFNQELAQTKLTHMRSQLDPHFIFNSLNTLDELIQEDKETASEYLNDFADLYRIAINHTKNNMVSIEQELSFTQHYFNLMQMRLPQGFSIQIEGSAKDKVIPPFTLQLLVENALLHNSASPTNPLCINIGITSDKIKVTNKIQHLAHSRKGSRVGLSNIQNQYKTLCNKAIQVEQSADLFSVTLPHIEKSDDI